MANPFDINVIDTVAKTVEKVTGTVEQGVTDYRSENTKRQENVHKHDEKMRELAGNQILQGVDKGIAAIRVLADGFSRVNDSLSNAKKNDDAAALAVEKENHEHQRKMKEIEDLAKKLEREFSKDEKNDEFIRNELKTIIEKMTGEYGRYLEMNDEVFLSDTCIKAREELRKSCMALTEQLTSWQKQS
jgi:hypothetical protein